MNFQVTILKVLVSYPDGFASLTDLKRDIAILATSGKEWSERTKRLATRVPSLAIFSQGLVDRLEGGWRITEQGRSVLEMMEAPVISDQSAAVLKPTRPSEPVPAKLPTLMALRQRSISRWRRGARRRRKRRRVV
jgi:hypothetical protein